MSESAPTTTPPAVVSSLWPRLQPWLQLVRLPNVFTAFADICLGALAAGALPARWAPFLLLLLASGCLYAGGMVWNDFFDYAQDYKERPFRPLPAGKVSRSAAALFGAALLLLGIVFAGLAGWQRSYSPALPAVVALVIVGCIFLYDFALKHTALGPLGMGACRYWNVVLGLCAADQWGGMWGWHLAWIVGIYITGVTWFARTEARQSKQASLTGAAFTMLAALVIALPLPAWFDADDAQPRGWLLFPYLLVAFGFALGLPLYHAIREPSPEKVQRAVKRCIMGLVVLDAILALGLAGPPGLLILLLLVPALYLGKWIYST
ncbi:MAG: UbiA family prenyltransferase [Planctomycetia bacterium]|nr:UbiA family prenyltransferase [Planctomycetia bacterium]